MRPARAADAGALQGLFHRLSEDDIYTRFFRRVRSLSYRGFANALQRKPRD